MHISYLGGKDGHSLVILIWGTYIVVIPNSLVLHNNIIHTIILGASLLLLNTINYQNSPRVS